MAMDYEKLKVVPRLLLEAELKPLQGERFQPTGFADLGAARYTLADGTEMLLVESTQSVANRMEMACWDEGTAKLISELEGLPYIQVKRDDKVFTNSILEAHRINSEYIMATEIRDRINNEAGVQKEAPIDWIKFRKVLAKYDIGSLIHGCFLEEIDGRLRITRLISGFIEARGIQIAQSGGVKNNFVQPTLKSGEGNVPYTRTEFTAEKITAYFNLDLALLRGYGLGEKATKLLIALSLFKVCRFLSTGLRLRTACDLEARGPLTVAKPLGFSLPSEKELLDECKTLIGSCKAEGLFANPPITEVTWKPGKKEKKQEASESNEENEE